MHLTGSRPVGDVYRAVSVATNKPHNSVSIAAPPGVSMELKPRFRENTHFNKRHFNNITVINVAWTLCEQQGLLFVCLVRLF